MGNVNGRSTTMTTSKPTRLRDALGHAALAVCVLTTAGCDDIFSLKQSSAAQIEAAGLYKPSNAQLLVNGVIADFECAFARTVLGMAVHGDELSNAWAATLNYDVDRRSVATNGPYAGGCAGAQHPSFYTALNTARGVADTTYVELSGWTDAEVPNRARLLAQTAAYGGYSLVMLGEVMCTGAINVGPELTSMQLFEEAKLRFDRALTHTAAANDPAVTHFARLGRARALLNLGRYDEAAADAATIPASFVIGTSGDETYTRRQNMVFTHVTQGFFGTVDPSYRNLTMENGAPDPRVRVTDQNRAGNMVGSRIWTPDKYPTAATPMPITRYAEAQLIIAEARIRSNNLPAAAAAINAARTSGGRTGMPVYSVEGKTQAQVLTDLVEERRREFFLEGRRYYDVRRFDLPLLPAPGTPYAAGGGTYGDQRCFPLPNVERNRNPNID
jgi:starch-binding outer membrane protein, SusD/RagB family